MDSGVEGAVEKEISVNLVDDAVRRILKENVIEILGNGFEQLNTDVVNHLDNNPELFKGDKGDIGPKSSKSNDPEDLSSDIINTLMDDVYYNEIKYEKMIDDITKTEYTITTIPK